MSQPPTSLSVVNNNGSLNFNSVGNYNCTSSSYTVSSNNKYSVIATNDIITRSNTGNLNISSDIGIITLNSNGNYNNAIVIEASNQNGGILQTAGTGGVNVTTSNGQINLLSKGSDINIGKSPIGTPANLQTKNLNLESLNNLNVNSGDMYFVSSDVISFVSTTGDIQFGASSNGAPIFKFENGNILVNQSTSQLDYQLDVAVSDESIAKKGYNGIVVNSIVSNVAADLTLQTSTNLGDGTQCILSMGSFGSNNNHAIFQKYLAYQVGSMVIRLDGPYYSPNAIDSGFGYDFLYSDIGREIYWSSTNRLDTIIELSSITTATSDTANVTVNGTYTGNTSRVYLLQIDSLGTPNTFMWSNNGGVSFQEIYVPIINTPINLDNGLTVLFSTTSGFYYRQQFSFQTKITALVSSSVSIPIPETMYTLQPFYSYISTTTPSNIVIKTNNNEKMRITSDGDIGIQTQMPTASFDLNSNFNKVLIVNETITGYQINPSISYLESGGYVIVWNSQDVTGSTYNFNVYGQRYMSDGSLYSNNFKINNTTANNQSYPSVAGNKLQNSNHYIVAWGSNHLGNGYNVYYQVFQNNKPLSNVDKILDSTADPSSNIIYPRCAGLYNGNYIVVWSADTNKNGIFAVYGAIIGDDINSTIIKSKFLLNAPSPYSRNYPYVAGLPSDNYKYINGSSGFVVGYMTALDSTADPRYTISMRLFDYNGVNPSAEIPITTVGSAAFSNISDGLLSVAEINRHNVNGNTNPIYLNIGNFVMTFYRNYIADASLYNIGDSVSGLISGSTASISATYPSQRIITLQNLSNRFLVSEEINIVSSNSNVSITIEKIAAINFITNTTANITLDIGSKDVMAYCFKSNVAQASDAVWSKQVNTTLLYSDLDRLTGNASVFTYKRPLSSVAIDNNGKALITWSNGSIPSVYYQLIDTYNGNFISTEQRLTSQYNGLKQRDQIATHLQSIEGNDYGFVISWDNQSLDLQSAGIYQQLIGYNHSLFSLGDGNSSLIYNHQNQMGVGINDPETTLHVKSQTSQNSSNFNDPDNTCTITIQNTTEHVITNKPLQSINFVDGLNNTLNTIQSCNSLRYDDLYPQPTNLVGFYKFDQTEGTQVIDYSSSSTNLNIFNQPVYINTNGILNNFDIETCWVPGLVNNSLLFNGNNNYVFVESNALNGLNTLLESAPNMLSLSLWVNVPSNVVVNSTYDIVSNGGNLSLEGTYLLYLRDVSNNGNMVVTSNIIVNGIKNIGLIGNTKINDSKWHHIVETVDLSSGSNCVINLYVDGVIENTINTSGIVNVLQHNLIRTYFGSRNGNSNFFRGNMDELRFYKSILSSSEVLQLYKYGNPNLPSNASLILSPNTNVSYNQSIIIDDNGKINNLSSRPLPFSVLSGEIIAYKNSVNITGVNGTKFLNELTVGDIIVLDISQNLEFTVINILNNTNATLDRVAYSGSESSISYQSVLRRPSIYTFFDNSDSIKGYIDNYGNMMIGSSKPSTMMEISGYSYNSITNINNIPELSITNLTQENIQNGRMTAINFKCYNTSNLLNDPVQLGRIETSHYGTNNDKKGIMKFSVNNGTVLNTLLSLTSNGNIGIGGGSSGNNTPLTLIHANTQSTASECELLLQSNYSASQTNFSVFDERSDLYFGGITSMTETIDPNIKKRVLSAISGSNNSNTKLLNGRLDLLTNNQSTGNGIESRMSITHIGNVGVSILQPSTIFQVAPELRLTNRTINRINSAIYNGVNTVITLSQNIFSLLSTPQRNLYIGGSVVVENPLLTNATILSVDLTFDNKLTVLSDLSSYVGSVIHVHSAGLNVIGGTGTSSCFTGVNTTTPTSVLSVNGSLSLPIVSTTSSITLNLNNYTVICRTNSNSIIVNLPLNNSSILGRIYIIKKYGTNSCEIRTTDGSLIDGSNIQNVNNFAQIQSDGTNWWQINYN
jgi:hypothetical protein